MSVPSIPVPADLQPLIQREMSRGEFSTPEQLLRSALEFWAEHRETLAALEEALDELDAGLGRPWSEIDREFRTRNGLSLSP